MEIDFATCQIIAEQRIFCPRCGEPISIIGFTESITHGTAMLVTCLRCYPEGETK